MTRFLTLAEVLHLHILVVDRTGGLAGVRDLPALESSVAQPTATFSGQFLYPGVVPQAAALCFFLVRNHPFHDGNKRTGHAAMDAFLRLNGFRLSAEVEEQERIMLSLAAGDLNREAFTLWVEQHVAPRASA